MSSLLLVRSLQMQRARGTLCSCGGPRPRARRPAARVLIETCRRSAPTGLTTKSVAPARIAEITASIEPCAVWTMVGTARPVSRRRGQHAHAVEVRHDEVEDHQVDRRLVPGLEPCQRPFAALDGFGGVAEPTHQRLQQTALDGVVVDDQDGAGHRASDWRTRKSPARWAMSAIRVNRPLSRTADHPPSGFGRCGHPPHKSRGSVRRPSQAAMPTGHERRRRGWVVGGDLRGDRRMERSVIETHRVLVGLRKGAGRAAQATGRHGPAPEILPC